MNRLAINASWYIPGLVFGSTECCLDILLISFGQMRMFGMEILKMKKMSSLSRYGLKPSQYSSSHVIWGYENTTEELKCFQKYTTWPCWERKQVKI